MLGLAILAGCGGGGDAQSPALEPPTTAVQGEAGGFDAAGLPAIGSLVEPERTASLAGPGWLEFFADEELYRYDAQGLAGAGGTLTLADAGATAFVVYCIGQFDHDAFPTSLRVTAENVEGQFYVAFADFLGGAWRTTGPYDGTVEAQIPGVDDYSSPLPYVSPRRNCYVALIAPAGSSLEFSGLALGVHGGQLGPRPGRDLFIENGTSGRALHWVHSPDYLAPDFAGYIVERAPAFSGMFSPITPEPASEDHYRDTSLEPGVGYRYRVCAVDVSGNRSAYFTEPDELIIAGGNCVAVLDLPRGPLAGPVELTFDMSRSFDLDGDPLAEYTIYLDDFSPAAYTGPDAQPELTLQPGCYNIRVVVGSGLDTASCWRRLKVLPRWEAEPVLVSAPAAPTMPVARQQPMAAGFLPATNEVVFFGYDATIPGYTAWHGTAVAGFEMDYCMTQVAVQHICDPVEFQGALYAVANTGTSARFLIYDADGLTVGEPLALATPLVQLVTDGTDRLYLVAAGGGGPYFLFMFSLQPPAMPGEIAPLPGEPLVFDAALNVSTGNIEIVCGTNAELNWYSYDVDSAALADSELLAPLQSFAVDLEVDPATGRPAVLYQDGGGIDARNLYTALSAGGTWSAAEPVDDGSLNYTPLDLTLTPEGTYASFAVFPGQFSLYQRSGGSWAPRNAVSYSNNSGYDFAITPVPGTSLFYVNDVDNPRSMTFARLRADGGDSVIDNIPASNGQGFQLQAAAGDEPGPAGDALHAIWRNELNDAIHHVLSLDGGDNWVAESDLPGGTFFDLAANSPGEIYLSGQLGDSGTLAYWDGANFMAEENAVLQSGSHTVLGAKPYRSGVVWLAQQSTGDALRVGGDQTLGFSSATEPYIFDERLRGGLINLDAYDETMLLISNFSYNYVGLYEFFDQTITEELSYFVADPAPDLYLLHPLTGERTMATATFATDFGEDPRDAFIFTHGPDFDPVRYERPGASSFGAFPALSTLELPAPGPCSTLLRTASAVIADGLTAVTILGSADGREQRLEWSNFGEWESLPLPEVGTPLAWAELVVARDGRWFILYKDLLADSIYCLGTE